MPDDPHPRFWQRHVAGLVVFLLGMCLSLYFWAAAHGDLEATIRVRVADRVAGVEERLKDRISAYENVLFGAAGMLQANLLRISPGQWRIFGENLGLQKRYQGFNALAYVALLTPAEVAEHETRMRRWGIADYRVRGDRRQARISAVTLLYPETYTRSTYGMDLMALGPQRRQAIERARDLGELTLTSPIVPAAGPSVRQGVSVLLAYAPVYDPRLPHGSVEERRAAFRGVAFIATYIRDMFERRLAAEGDVNIHLFDVNPDGSRTYVALLAGATPGTNATSIQSDAIKLVRVLSVGGRHWQIEAVPALSIATPWERNYPAVLLVLGFGISASFAVALWNFMGTHRQALEIARRMTAELRSSREALQAKSSELELIQTTSPLGLFRTDAQGVIVLANPRATHMLAGTGSEWTDSLDAEDRERVNAAMDSLVGDTTRDFALEFRADRADESRWLRVTGAAAGAGRAIVGTVEDVTERKRNELELERTREFLRAVLDMLPVGVYARDAQSRFVLENAYAVEFLSGDMRSVLGKTLFDVFDVAYARRAQEEDRHVMTTAESWTKEGEFTNLRGQRHWVRMYKRGLVLSNGERYVVGVNIDLTERHRLDMEARSAKDFIAALLNALPTPLFVKSGEGTYFMVNRAFGRLHGRAPEDFVGMTDADFIGSEMALANARVNEQLILDGGSVAVEEFVTRREGPGCWILKNKARIGLPDGRQYIVGVMLDIDELVSAREELRQHRDNLQQLVEQRTSELVTAVDHAQAASRAKSEFLANISHELRTPMHAILSFAMLGQNLVSRSPTGNEKAERYFSRIHMGATRLMTLLNDLLDIAKLESGKMEYDMAICRVDLLVNDATQEFAAMCRERRVRVVTAPGPDMSVWADALRIGQVLRNLLSNAIKFSPEGGAVHVQWHVSDTTDEMVHLAISDEGVGIPEGELAQIFDKFVQSSKTKTGAGGTGLGLSICREIVLAHRGRLWAENNPQGGATFHLRLPSREPQTNRDELSVQGV